MATDEYYPYQRDLVGEPNKRSWEGFGKVIGNNSKGTVKLFYRVFKTMGIGKKVQPKHMRK